MHSSFPHFTLWPPSSSTQACPPPPQCVSQSHCPHSLLSGGTGRSSRRQANHRIANLLESNSRQHSASWELQASAKPFYVQQEDDISTGNGSSAPSTSRTASSRPRSRVISLNTVVERDTQEQPVDEVGTPTPSAGAKTLKINIDLLLWRSRQSRLEAKLTLDAEKRRNLMRSAEEGLRRCLDLDPGDGRTYVVLGKLLTMDKRYDEARRLYTEGCQNTGNTNPYIWSAWGWLEFKTNNIDRARKLFDAATVVSPTHAAAWHKWGTLEKFEGKYGRARDLWLKGISLCKQQNSVRVAYLYNALACMSAQLGNAREARFWFREGTSSMSGKASTALWQAWCVLEAREKELAPPQMRQLFKRSVESNPRSRYVHLAWALWEREQGNLDLCIALQKRGLQFNPTDAALYSNLAITMWKDCGNVEAARGLFEEGIRANPSDLYVWQSWGYMEGFYVKNLDRARELFQRGVWADPRSLSTAVILHAWGMLERRSGNFQLARTLFRAAVRVDAKNENVWGAWITMERDLGNLERADELEIKLNESRWEFEVPAGFSTRVDGSPATALSRVTDMLRRFFTMRGDGKGSASPTRPGAPPAPPPSSATPSAFAQPPAMDSPPTFTLDEPSLASGSTSMNAAAAAAGTGAGPRRTGLQLDDVLPPSVRTAQAGALQQDQQQRAPHSPAATPGVPASTPPARAGSPTAAAPTTTAAPPTHQQQPQQPQQQRSPSPARDAPYPTPTFTTTTAASSSPASPPHTSSPEPPLGARPSPGSSKAGSPSPSRRSSSSSSGSGSPSASPSPPTTTTTGDARRRGSSPGGVGTGRGAGVGVGGGPAPVARPARDAALTAAGREVEKPLEQALQDLVGESLMSVDTSMDLDDAEEQGSGSSSDGGGRSRASSESGDVGSNGVSSSNGRGGRGEGSGEGGNAGAAVSAQSNGQAPRAAQPQVQQQQQQPHQQEPPQKSVQQQLLELVGEGKDGLDD